MEYKEYFDLLSYGPKALLTLWPILIMLAAGVIVLLLIHKRKINIRYFKSRIITLIFTYVWTIGALIFGVISFSSVLKEYIELKDILIEKRYQVIEGIVSDFHPMPYAGHEFESFTINGVKFEYSDYVVTNAFNNTRSHGGPINEGKYVKIYYYDRKILTLFIKEEG